MESNREIHVRSLGAAGSSGGSDEVLQLSDMDHCMPKLYVQMIEIFELPETTEEERKSIVDNLVKGLQRALFDYPILTGTLHFDNEAKRIVVKRRPDSAMTLHIREADDIPSFSVLDKYDFPVHILDSTKVLPRQFVAENFIPTYGKDISSGGPNVAGAQVTFIKGGLILGLAIPHQVCDGPGFEAFLNAWSRFSFAATTAKGADPDWLGDLPAEVPDRSIMTAKERPQLTAEELEGFVAKFPTIKMRDGPPAPPPADFKMPVVKTRIWHFPKSKLQELKEKCSVGLEPGTWISTYDALLAIMWRATVRAKSPLLKPSVDAPSKAVHAVNARGRAAQNINERYIGTAITIPISKLLTVGQVLGDLDATLPILAQKVRASTNSITPDYVNDLIKYAAGSRDMRYSELDMDWILSLDVMAFDWHTMKSYQKHDFGFGRPAALRWPNPGFEGFFFVLPTRAGVRNAGEDEGVEVCFGLEESCFAELEKDVEFARYAKQRGLGVENEMQ
ncbi:hypothetical protein G7054_g4908 [Neopestalotiopsis clavispora]|nr:hypothetical protein G7054_g4908 [Neopestalotiopsis clavispora]